ncbi:MAG: 2-C-methyl-D-erythritol 4-phosphate cytidylyltransferase, partial [Planctomycetota bacterium]|nr:2-C-methyl-D-erythritol 4-phosphate cytidylyltransferase [Planctomycetota bacterium]
MKDQVYESFPSTGLVLVAAGKGERLLEELGERKQNVSLAGRRVFLRTIDAFKDLHFIDQIVLVVREEDRETIGGILSEEAHELVRNASVVCGGTRRQDSVINGVRGLAEEIGWAAIHDGVRPFVNPADVTRTVEAAQQIGAAILAVPAVETVKRSQPHEGSPEDLLVISETPSRKTLWNAQTPQVFPREKYL